MIGWTDARFGHTRGLNMPNKSRTVSLAETCSEMRVRVTDI